MHNSIEFTTSFTLNKPNSELTFNIDIEKGSSLIAGLQ